MARYFKYFVVGILVMVSCKPNETDTPLDPTPIEINQEVKISSIGVVLSPEARKKTEDWLKYQLVKSKIEGYSKVTKNEALLNAKLLSELIIDVSDTIDIEILDRSDMKIRFNVLNNHVLRLDDMSTIPRITDEEVENEVKKVLNAFSSINEKINTLIKIDEFDIEIENSEIAIEEIEEKGRKYSSKSPSQISAKKRFDDRKNKRRDLLRKKKLKKND